MACAFNEGTERVKSLYNILKVVHLQLRLYMREGFMSEEDRAGVGKLEDEVHRIYGRMIDILVRYKDEF